MKKLLILPVVLAVAACGTDDVQKVDVFGTECDVVATSVNGDSSVKCPVTPELEAIQAMEANSMFVSGDFAEKNITEYAADTEGVWVNLNPNECGDGTMGYRVMVKNPVLDGVAMYAVSQCM